jgi:hypothetical protein
MNRAEAAAILGVSPAATPDEARKAYLARARLLHPDRFAGASPEDIKAANDAMAQLNEAQEAFTRSGASSATSDAQTTPQSDQSGQAPPAPSDPWNPADGACELCGWGPAAPTKFNSVTGLVILWKWSTLKAPMCRRCGIAMYNESQRSTLLKGWWGVIAPIATIIAFLSNAARVRAVRRLPEPKSRALGAVTPFSEPIAFSRPWYSRPASLVATAAALLIITIVALVLLVPTPGNLEQPATVGSCWSFDEGVGTEVDCGSAEAEYIVSDRRYTSNCPGEFFTEADGSSSCLEPLDESPTADNAQPLAEQAEPSLDLSVAGIPAAEVRTCIEGPDVEKSCDSGSSWVYAYCWRMGPERTELQKRSGTSWSTVDTFTAAYSDGCKDSETVVEYAGQEERPGIFRYRVRIAETGQLDPFTVTVTAPARYFETCVDDIATGDTVCQSGLKWSIDTCWDGSQPYTLQKFEDGTWTTTMSGSMPRDPAVCKSAFPYLLTLSGKELTTSTAKYRVIFSATSDLLGSTEEFSVTTKVQK